MKKISSHIKSGINVFVNDMWFIFATKILLRTKVASVDDSLEMILSGNNSLARFGDGELRWAAGIEQNYFNQRLSPEFSEALRDVLRNPEPGVLIGMPGPIGGVVRGVTKRNARAWKTLIRQYGNQWGQLIPRESKFVDANITRLYMDRSDREKAKERFGKLRQLWSNRNILIVEGDQTNFGVGNDFLSNANNVRRIEAPNEDAFSKYDQIYSEIIKQYTHGELVLIALGPTATILVNDLAKLGIQSVDIGHADLEYSWFQAQAQERVLVPGKYVNELEGDKYIPLSKNTSNLSILDQIVSIIK